MSIIISSVDQNKLSFNCERGIIMMYETQTKMIGVGVSAGGCRIFSLTVNLLVLAILPLSALAKPNQVMAQGTTNESNSKQAANTSTAPTALEPAILSEINRVRTNPQNYAQWLEEQRQYYDGVWLRLPGEKAIRTNRGKKALEEAIAFLKEQQPLPPLKTSPQAAATASSELENFATANNIQYFSYGRKTAAGIVMGLVVDELFPDRRRRHSLLSPDAENTGVVCKPDPRYAKICAIAYSDLATTADVAEEKPEEEKPENVATPDSEDVREDVVGTVADLPETISAPETAESPKATEPEVTRTPPARENIENPENSDIATLPQPPQPQVPPAPPEAREEQSPQAAEVDDNSKLESEVEASESETEEIVEDQSAPVADNEAEAEIAEIIVNESEIKPESELEASESETEEIVEDQSAPVADSEAEAEIAEIIEDESEQVAINSENAGLLEKVERGSLEKGDRVIADDGSLYDFYPLEGKAGDSFTIYLESDEFDAFVALVDSQGNTIKENDDISESDSNSRIRVTLPEDGTYNIIVNTYDQQGTGKYVLTVSR